MSEHEKIHTIQDLPIKEFTLQDIRAVAISRLNSLSFYYDSPDKKYNIQAKKLECSQLKLIEELCDMMLEKINEA